MTVARILNDLMNNMNQLHIQYELGGVQMDTVYFTILDGNIQDLYTLKINCDLKLYICRDKITIGIKVRWI